MAPRTGIEPADYERDKLASSPAESRGMNKSPPLRSDTPPLLPRLTEEDGLSPSAAALWTYAGRLHLGVPRAIGTPGVDSNPRPAG